MTEQVYHARGAGRETEHWPEIYHTANGYKVQCECGWNSKSIKGVDPDEGLKVMWKEHVTALREPGADTGTTPPPFSEVINAWQAANHATGSLADMLDSLKEFASAYRAATQRAPVEQGAPPLRQWYESTPDGMRIAVCDGGSESEAIEHWNTRAAAPDHAREGALREALELAKGALANGSTIDQRYETYKIVCAALADGKEGGE